MIADYIRNQPEEDFAKDQSSRKEFADPFTGERNKQGKTNSHLSVAACNRDAMIAFKTPLESEQTTSLLVVMIYLHGSGIGGAPYWRLSGNALCA